MKNAEEGVPNEEELGATQPAELEPPEVKVEPDPVSEPVNRKVCLQVFVFSYAIKQLFLAVTGK